MKLAIKKKYINIRVISFCVYNLVYVFYMLGYLPRTINLVTLITFTGICLFFCFGKKHFKFIYETKKVSIVIGFIIAISVVIQMYHGGIQSFLFTRLMYVILPLVDSFAIINSSDDKEIEHYIYIIFIRLALLFVLQNASNFSLSSILAISWSDSGSSVFESSMAHEFLFLVVIFKYLKKDKLAILSAILCMLSFKRISFVLSIVTLVSFKFIDQKKEVNKRLLTITKAMFIIAPLILSWLVSDMGQNWFQNTFGISMNVFTTGRVYYINLVKNNMPYFNGYGSTSNYLANVLHDEYVADIHCDLLRLTWECTAVATILYVNNMFDIVKKNYTLYFMMLYCFIEMFVSHFIEGWSTWVLVYLFIYLINRDRIDMEKLGNRGRNKKWMIR